jgi:hypothetical protein
MSNSLIDADTLTRLNDLGGSDLIVKMVELFSEHAPKRLQAASEGLEKATATPLNALYTRSSRVPPIWGRPLFRIWHPKSKPWLCKMTLRPLRP